MSHSTCWLLAALAITTFPQVTLAQQEWTGEVAALAAFKMDPETVPSKKYLENYIRYGSPETWKLCVDNEFRRRREREVALKAIAEQVEKFKLDSGFVLRTQTEFGEYDFEQQGFTVKHGYRGYTLRLDMDYQWNPNPPNVGFVNFEILECIKVEPDVAEKLIESRKDKNGRSRRDIKVDITFELLGPQENPGHPLAVEQIFKANIVGVKFYEDDDRKKVLYEYSDPTKKEAKPAITAEDILREVEGDSTKKDGQPASGDE